MRLLPRALIDALLALPEQIAQLQSEAVLGAMRYKGTWNAATNAPALSSSPSASTRGFYYIVATAGTTAISGISDWKVGDWIVSNGTSWDKVDSSDQVNSVAGLMGTITPAQLTAALLSFTLTDKGLVPAPGGAATGRVLTDGGWALPVTGLREETYLLYDADQLIRSDAYYYARVAQTVRVRPLGGAAIQWFRTTTAAPITFSAGTTIPAAETADIALQQGATLRLRGPGSGNVMTWAHIQQVPA